jgi:ribosomal protein S18 acetylase RimI-like enzyme
MQIQIKNDLFEIRRLVRTDLERLIEYLQTLSPETRSRFGPHPFDRHSVELFYNDSTNRAYLAVHSDSGAIAAYCIVKSGFIEYDIERFRSYGIIPDNSADYTLAPSVADAWQSCGLGSVVLRFILDDLIQTNAKRLFLWGGVQASNQRAVNYYQKFGFRLLGQFFHQVDNFDMVLDLE